MIKEISIDNEYVNRDEIIIIDYEGIIQLSEIPMINEVFRRVGETYNAFIDMGIIECYDNEAMIPILMKRPEKNILKWLSKKSIEEDLDELYIALKAKYDDVVYNYNLYTDFALNLNALLRQGTVKKIVFTINDADIKYKENVNKLITNNIDKVSILTYKNDEDLLSKIHSQYSDFTTIFIDNYKFISNYITKFSSEVELKSFIIPFHAYNMIEKKGVLFLKDDLEVKAHENNCSMGLVKLFNLKNDTLSCG